MGARQTWILDIDNTLLKSERTCCKTCGRYMYRLTSVNRELVTKVNARYAMGDTIIVWTGRGWDMYDLTSEHLRRIGLHYSELYMGKPNGTIVDADAVRSLP